MQPLPAFLLGKALCVCKSARAATYYPAAANLSGSPFSGYVIER